MKLRLVRQKNRRSGCGPACVAMVAGVSYETAIKAMWDGTLWKNDLYSLPRDLRRALRALGAQAAPRVIKIRTFDKGPGLGIFACWKGTPKEHWVLYDPSTGRLYDPLEPSFIKKPLDALNKDYRPYYYLSVEMPPSGSSPFP